jgi:hypothetical protein
MAETSTGMTLVQPLRRRSLRRRIRIAEAEGFVIDVVSIWFEAGTQVQDVEIAEFFKIRT